MNASLSVLGHGSVDWGIVAIFATVYAVQTVPRGFIPTLDQGYGIVVVQLPDGRRRAPRAPRRRRSRAAPDRPGLWEPR